MHARPSSLRWVPLAASLAFFLVASCSNSGKREKAVTGEGHLGTEAVTADAEQAPPLDPAGEPERQVLGSPGETLGLQAAGGGPGGDFDWVVHDGELFIFDTTATTIIGGPGGLPTSVQNSVNGFVEVRDLIIEEGGEIRVQGPNIMTVDASRNVVIRGELDLSGYEGRDVATLNTGNQPEVGGAGAAAGGRGGNSSELTTTSTPRGGTGVGAFGAPGLGGQGGESGFAPSSLGEDARRPGGGGGGRFAMDACDPAVDPANECAPTSGLFAESGFPGSSQATGAESGMSPPAGGHAGAPVFVDADPANDFFGTGPRFDPDGRLNGTIAGELPQVWAGAGGGGGGDAIPSASFPSDPWSPGSDEKGGAGGGGGGGLHVRALAKIVFGPLGQIRSQGGRGGVGENTLFLNHIGGTGGAGSGGHVVLEAAGKIDFTDGGRNADGPVRDWIRATGGPRRVGPATTGGAVSYGGSGGPGVIQLHVRRPQLGASSDPGASNITVPFAAAAEDDPFAAIASPAALPLYSSIAATSTARSPWLPVGRASTSAGDGRDLVSFLFADTETRPESAAVTVRYQAAGADAAGLPDADHPLTGWTSDPTELDTLEPGAVRFFRFEIEVDPNARGQGLSRAVRPAALDFLRIPLRF